MYEKLVKYAAKQLEIEASDIHPDSTFESLGIDSLDIVEMIMDLESELGVELDMEEPDPHEFGIWVPGIPVLVEAAKSASRTTRLGYFAPHSTKAFP